MQGHTSCLGEQPWLIRERAAGGKVSGSARGKVVPVRDGTVWARCDYNFRHFGHSEVIGGQREDWTAVCPGLDGECSDLRGEVRV
jgi:hypothetical protein